MHWCRCCCCCCLFRRLNSIFHLFFHCTNVFRAIATQRNTHTHKFVLAVSPFRPVVYICSCWFAAVANVLQTSRLVFFFFIHFHGGKNILQFRMNRNQRTREMNGINNQNQIERQDKLQQKTISSFGSFVPSISWIYFNVKSSPTWLAHTRTRFRVIRSFFFFCLFSAYVSFPLAGRGYVCVVLLCTCRMSLDRMLLLFMAWWWLLAVST